MLFLQVVRVLVEAGADVNLAGTADGRMPLCAAVALGNSNVVGRLVRAGANLNQVHILLIHKTNDYHSIESTWWGD